MSLHPVRCQLFPGPFEVGVVLLTLPQDEGLVFRVYTQALVELGVLHVLVSLVVLPVSVRTPALAPSYKNLENNVI